MGMILADTPVWVDHFRKPEPGLLEHLAMNGVLMHPMVIGELSCGNLPRRKTVLRQLLSLPRIPEPAHESVLSFIESKELMGRGSASSISTFFARSCARATYRCGPGTIG